MFNQRPLYIFFVLIALNIFLFSTSSLKANAFLVDEIEILEKLENNFNKDLLINKGFKKAFNELLNTLVKSSDLKKIKNTRLNEIKGMIESFSLKEEKFIEKTYQLNLGVSFNKKKIYNFLEKKNIFPSQIVEKTFLFIPVIIDQKDGELLVFSNNPIYENWKTTNKKSFLIKYLLPTEDLEDFETIKEKSSTIENYDFKKIIEKYYLEHSIVALIFKDDDEIKVLSKITIKDKKIIKNSSFKNFDFNNEEKIKNLMNELKIIYEDLWKEYNQINTSIKLQLLIQVDNKNLNTSIVFENNLNAVDLISSYSISEINRDFIFYEVIFNGTPKNFINIMSNKNYNFDTQKKIWILQ
jgi:hypothetical protein